jgi:hypothetical protein
VNEPLETGLASPRTGLDAAVKRKIPCWMDFHETWYELYAIEGHPKLLFLMFFSRK